ncbi:unnamed protein product, partial [Notodromas monacha]
LLIEWQQFITAGIAHGAATGDAGQAASNITRNAGDATLQGTLHTNTENMKVLAVFAFLCVAMLASATKPVPTTQETVEMLDTWTDCLTCVGLECAFTCGFSCASGDIVGCIACVTDSCSGCWDRCDELKTMHNKFY